ncbi:MAG: biotin/lipoyl-containing protein, partial [Pseudomonadota bacterium]
MAINITMPALSPTMEEGTLAKWNVKPGDTVEAGDVIAEIETDKATMEVEAVDEGTVAQILVDEGTEGVKVNAVIAVLAEEGEDASSVYVNIIDIENSYRQSTGNIGPYNLRSDNDHFIELTGVICIRIRVLSLRHHSGCEYG